MSSWGRVGVVCPAEAAKWRMTSLAPTSLTPMGPPDYHGNMARKSSQQRLKAPLGRGGQWLELTITLPSARAEALGETLVALGSPGVVQERTRRVEEVSDGQGLEMA